MTAGQTFEFRILGPLEVVADGTPVALGGPKARALLAFLLLQRGEVVSRERLVDELWGERPPKAVAAELRVYVAKLRKALRPELLATRPDGYALLVDAEAVDAERFERGAWHGSALLAAGDVAPAARVLTDALALWRAPVLADLAYQPWVQSEALRLDELRLAALEERLEAELALGRPAGVAAELGRLVVEHPYRERLRAQLMVALYRSGRQADALAAYRQFQRLLGDELGLNPNPELQRLERMVLTHDAALDLPGTTPVPPSAAHARRADRRWEVEIAREVTERAPFVERKNALARLLDHLRLSLDGHSEIAFVQGEAGAGKTALLAEFARRAESTDPELIVVSGQCPPYTGTVDPYAPFRQAFSMLFGDLQEALATGFHPHDQARRLWAASPYALETVLEHSPGLVDALVPARAVIARGRASAAELGGRLDELLASSGSDPRGLRLPPDQIRSESIRVLEQISRHQPVVVLLDDLQWADPSTLDVLRGFAESRVGARLAIVGAYRPEDVGDGWNGLLNDIKRRRGEIVVDLDEAAPAEAGAFVDALLDHEPNRLGERLRDQLTERSEGHAMFAVELIRELKENGGLRRDSMGRWTESPSVAWDRWPARIEGILAERFRRLDEDTLDTLRVASVEGEEFTADVVAAVQGLSLETVVERLSAGTTGRHHILRGTGAQRLAGTRVLRYRFRHNLYQGFLYDGLDDVRRASLHERIGSALEALGANADDEFALPLAHHFERAGIAERAIAYFSRAGLRALRLSANEQAVEHFNRAIALVEQLAGGDERDRTEADLQLQRAIALGALRGFSAPEVEQAYTRATELMMGSAATREQFPIHWGVWIFHSARGNFERSTRLVERMTELASQGDESMRLQALHARWAESFLRGWIDGAVAAAEEGRSIYRPEVHHGLTFRYGNHDPGVCALAVGALALALQGDSGRAIAGAREAVDLSDAVEHSFSRAHARSLQAWVFQIIGDVEIALREAERALALEAELDAPQFFAIARAVRGWALSSSGRYEESIAELEGALVAHLAVAADTYAAMAVAFIAEAHLRSRRDEPARAAVEQMRSLSKSIGTYVYTAEFLRIEAQSLALEGRDTDARRLLLDAIGTAREQGSWTLALRAAVALACLRSAEYESDLGVLAEVVEHLPAECGAPETHEARVLLSQRVAPQTTDGASSARA